MKKWTMLLALLLATVFCFPGALAEQEAVESTGDNGGGQLVSHVYEPGDIASGLLAQAFGQEHGTMIVAEVRGEGIPLEAEMPDLVLRLGVAFSQGARLELGLRESQENVGFDIALDADAQGLAIASDLLPDERYTMNWETLLGMNLEEMTAGLLGTLEPLMEPYVAIVDEFMQELSVKEFYDVPEEYGFPAVAYEIYITCTHAQAAELLTRLADQLEGDGQLAPVLDVMLASQGLGSAAIVEMMRGAAGSLAQSEGHFVLGAGTNYDAAAEPWYVIVTNTQEDGATDEWYLSFEPYAEENTPYFFDLGYSQTLVDGSLGDGMQLIVGILSIPDTALTGWGVQLTVSEGETDTGLLRIRALKRPTTTEEGLPGYGGEVYIGVGNPEIVMEYEHEMNAFMTPDGGEAFTLEGTLCPDAAQSADTYAFTLEAGVEPGPDGLQGRGRLMIGTEDMPELTGLSFELHEAEPLQLGGTVCMLVGAMAAAESPTENGFSALELPADEILDMNLDRNRGTEAIQWTQTEDGAGVKMTVAEEDGTQAEWSMDCSQAQVWIADLDRNGVKEICVSGDPMSDDDVTWCLTYEAGELKPLPFEGAEYAQGRITGMDAEGMTMAGYVDALGTHMGIRRLTVEDGKLVTVGDGLWHFEYDLQSEETWAQQALTAKTAVPVTYVDLTGKESRGELAAEIKILITATDGVSRAWFTVQDGRRGYLTIAPDETAGWGYIIGGVGEQALFEGIRYAG